MYVYKDVINYLWNLIGKTG